MKKRIQLRDVMTPSGENRSPVRIEAGSSFIGEKTFGTGTVLKRFFLSDGSALMLAVQEWLTPAGRIIWHQEISPDVVISLPPDGTPLFPRAEKGMTAEELKNSGDV